MNVVPRRWHTEDLKPTIWYAEAEGIIIECEAVSPPSSVGKTVYVHIRGEEVETMLKELRDVAIARRQKPMGAVS